MHDDHTAIHAVVHDYFDGLYQGDVEKLRRIFSEDAWLESPGSRKTRDDWLEAVASRPVPEKEGMEYGFSILSSEIVGDQAMVKAYAPLPAANYIDFLGLLKEDGRWRIVNKMFTAV